MSATRLISHSGSTTRVRGRDCAGRHFMGSHYAELERRGTTTIARRNGVHTGLPRCAPGCRCAPT